MSISILELNADALMKVLERESGLHPLMATSLLNFEHCLNVADKYSSFGAIQFTGRLKLMQFSNTYDASCTSDISHELMR